MYIVDLLLRPLKTKHLYIYFIFIFNCSIFKLCEMCVESNICILFIRIFYPLKNRVYFNFNVLYSPSFEFYFLLFIFFTFLRLRSIYLILTLTLYTLIYFLLTYYTQYNILSITHTQTTYNIIHSIYDCFIFPRWRFLYLNSMSFSILVHICYPLTSPFFTIIF